MQNMHNMCSNRMWQIFRNIQLRMFFSIRSPTCDSKVCGIGFEPIKGSDQWSLIERKKNILDISTWTSGRNPVKLLPVNFTLMANWTGVSVVGVTEEERLVVIAIRGWAKKHELLIKSTTKNVNYPSDNEWFSPWWGNPCYTLTLRPFRSPSKTWL